MVVNIRLKKKRGVLTALLEPILFVGCATPVIAQSFTVFDAPNASATFVAGINDSGDVTGNFTDVSQSNKQRSYVRDREDGSITVFDAPNASATYGTVTTSINNGGEVAGYFDVQVGQGIIGHSFVRTRNGKFTIFDAPNAAFTLSSSINDRGDVVGCFSDVSQGTLRGFLRDRKGDITFIDGPESMGTIETCPTSINNRGDVTGYFEDGLFYLHGFVLDVDRTFTAYDVPTGLFAKGKVFARDPGGNLIAFDVPNGLFTKGFSINDRGDITGEFVDQSYVPHGFLRDRKGGFTVFDAPNAGTIDPQSINYGGEVVGTFGDVKRGEDRGFRRDQDGEVTVFDAPNASNTWAVSINNGGEVAGYFADTAPGNRIRGFVLSTSGPQGSSEAPENP